MSYVGEGDIVPPALLDESPFEGVPLDGACEKQSGLSHKPTPHDESKDAVCDLGDQVIKLQRCFARVGVRDREHRLADIVKVAQHEVLG
jgi:hypothetical protein